MRAEQAEQRADSPIARADAADSGRQAAKGRASRGRGSGGRATHAPRCDRTRAARGRGRHPIHENGGYSYESIESAWTSPAEAGASIWKLSEGAGSIWLMMDFFASMFEFATVAMAVLAIVGFVSLLCEHGTFLPRSTQAAPAGMA